MARPVSGKATSTLESHIWRLRRVLEPDRTAGQSPQVLTNDAGGYCLQVDDEHIDSKRFERLAEQIRDLAGGGEPRAALALCQEALELWRGRPYETLADHELIAPIVSRLDELAAEVQERRVDALLAVGETEQALAAASSLLDAAPFRERLWVQRMLGLYRLGRSEEALRVYQQARTVLLEEVGVEPGPELREVHSQILRQDPILMPTALTTEPDRSGARLTFAALGPLEVLCDGARLDLGPPKQRAVLGRLLLAGGRVVSADELVETLWAAIRRLGAMASLQAYVSKLRNLLHGIASVGPGWSGDHRAMRWRSSVSTWTSSVA